MTPLPDSVWTVLFGTGGGGAVAWFLVRRGLDKFDRMGDRVGDLERRMDRLATKDDVATKEDVAQVSARLDRVDATLGQVQILLARLEERWKLTHGE